MKIFELRQRIKSEEFDSLILKDALANYRNPRAKITQMLKKGEIIQVKRGIYVFGEKWRRRPISLEVIANMMYGPSYISLEYALSYWGLIPERVSWITSVTLKRTKEFRTNVGNFYYQFLNLPRYKIGSTFVQIDDLHQMHIALPEKALADHVAKKADLTNFKMMQEYLIENLRIEEESLFNLNHNTLREISNAYHNHQVKLLVKVHGGMRNAR